MSFNKGDFTQQGVNGHVNATVRLNEKRLVNIDMTSNEEAEGCTITGTVTDLLNNEVYPIGAGVSGNIEITENGENINVAPYATATVNVSGGGGAEINFITLTLNNIGSNGISLQAPIVTDAGYYTQLTELDVGQNIFKILVNPGDNIGLILTNGEFTGVSSDASNCSVSFDPDYHDECQLAATEYPAAITLQVNGGGIG